MYYDHISAYALGLYGCNYINWRRFKETKKPYEKDGADLHRLYSFIFVFLRVNIKQHKR